VTVRICCDAEENILQQNAFAYDKWSVSQFLPVTSQMFPDLKKTVSRTSKLSNKSVVK